MNGIIQTGIEQRLLDIAVAVAFLLAVALLTIHLVWQPVKRLWIIQWSLIGGLLLASGLFLPRQVVSLGLLSTNHATTPFDEGPASSESSTTEQSHHRNQLLSPSDRRAGSATEPTALRGN